MKQENWLKGFFYRRPIAVILCLSFLGVGTVSATAMVNGMDVPTLLASWNTKQVTVSQLQQGQLGQVIFIDVRSPEEYAEDHIGQSQLVPLSDIEAGFGIRQIRALVQTKQAPNQIQPTLVLYCTSGQRSVKAYKQLENSSLNIVVLKGGIKAWRQAVPAAKDTQILAPIAKGRSLS